MLTFWAAEGIAKTMIFRVWEKRKSCMGRLDGEHWVARCATLPATVIFAETVAGALLAAVSVSKLLRMAAQGHCVSSTHGLDPQMLEHAV